MTLLLALTLAAATPFTPKHRPYDVQHYALTVQLDTSGEFKNQVAITLKPTKALQDIELDAMGLDVQKAEVDGAEAKFVVKDDAAAHSGTLTIKSPKALAPGKAAWSSSARLVGRPWRVSLSFGPIPFQ